MDNDEVIYRFLDRGLIHGIPARDLTQQDFDKLPLLLQRDVRSGKLYEPVSDEAPPQVPTDTTPNFEAMTKAQIVAYATEHGIDLGGLDDSDTKAELVEAVTAGSDNSAGESQQSAGDGGNGGES